MELGKMKFKLNNEKMIFNMCQSMKQPNNIKVVYFIHTIDGNVDIFVVPIEKSLEPGH